MSTMDEIARMKASRGITPVLVDLAVHRDLSEKAQRYEWLRDAVRAFLFGDECDTVECGANGYCLSCVSDLEEALANVERRYVEVPQRVKHGPGGNCSCADEPEVVMVDTPRRRLGRKANTPEVPPDPNAR